MPLSLGAPRWLAGCETTTSTSSPTYTAACLSLSLPGYCALASERAFYFCLPAEEGFSLLFTFFSSFARRESDATLLLFVCGAAFFRLPARTRENKEKGVFIFSRELFMQPCRARWIFRGFLFSWMLGGKTVFLTC